jgi:DNA replication protein DnaC
MALRQSKAAPPPSRPPGAEMAGAMLDLVAARAEANNPRENEYLDETTGLLRCRICGGKRQTTIQPFPDRPARVVRCWCGCPTGEDERKERDRLDEIERRRSICFHDTKRFKNWDFSKDAGKRPDLGGIVRRYAEKFPEYLKEGRGLVLYGDTGTGKSTFAAMIANAVLDKGYRAFMTNFEQIEKKLWDAPEKAGFMRELLGWDLLVLDDLGAERKNEYMQGIVYNVIDGRIRQGLPVIVTTNLTSDEMSKTDEMGCKRIYERLLRHCLPLNVDGPNYRRMEAGRVWTEMRQELGMEG